MTRLESIAAGVALLVLLTFTGWSRLQRFGAERYQAGHDAAIAAGNAVREREAAAARETEKSLRSKLAAADYDAKVKERNYEVSLESARRRMLVGTDRLRCPTGNPISTGAAAPDRPATSGSDAERKGSPVMREVAADILGIAGDVAGLVRRYERVIERFEECRAMNER